jgi:hypothetical protein
MFKVKEYKELELPKEYKRFEEIHPIHLPRKQAFNYLKNRGITQEIIDMFHKYFPPLNDHQASSDEIIEEKTFEEVTETDLELMDSDSDYSDSDYSDSEDSE